jgi:hypothetical protein
MKRYIRALGLAALISTALAVAQTDGKAAKSAVMSNNFDATADVALEAMRARAQALGVTGVAVVAYFEGETIQAWSSKMIVVGKYRDEPTASDKGSNLLGIAYAKAAEMADMHNDSGSGVRPPMTGEFGWKGGVIAHGKSGYVIAAFSGGKSEDDVAISREGLAKLKEKL